MLNQINFVTFIFFSQCVTAILSHDDVHLNTSINQLSIEKVRKYYTLHGMLSQCEPSGFCMGDSNIDSTMVQQVAVYRWWQSSSPLSCKCTTSSYNVASYGAIIPGKYEFSVGSYLLYSIEITE